jgi:hypothetical protein
MQYPWFEGTTCCMLRVNSRLVRIILEGVLIATSLGFPHASHHRLFNCSHSCRATLNSPLFPHIRALDTPTCDNMATIKTSTNVQLRDSESHNSTPTSEKIGTSEDQKDMHRMGKTQELRRNFRFISIFGYSMILMATWETVLT